MSANSSSSSSSSSDSLLHLNLSSYFPYQVYNCLNTSPGRTIFITFIMTNLCVQLPLSILVLHLGLQRRRQQRSASTAAMTSHSDSFTYHMVIMQLVVVLAGILCCVGIYKNVIVLLVGAYALSLTWYGEIVLHILTCVERYLAVVYPITYLSLKNKRGVRIRNISIGCAWLLSFVGTGLNASKTVPLIFDAFFMTFSSAIISFCSLSVLWVLIRPRVGEHGSDRDRGDQLRKRAFYTITAILGMLLMRCVYCVSWSIGFFAGGSDDCILFMSEVWVNLPCKLVLPLLFLQRAGMFACCKNNTKLDQH